MACFVSVPEISEVSSEENEKQEVLWKNFYRVKAGLGTINVLVTLHSMKKNLQTLQRENDKAGKNEMK